MCVCVCVCVYAWGWHHGVSLKQPLRVSLLREWRGVFCMPNNPMSHKVLYSRAKNCQNSTKVDVLPVRN